MEVILSATVHAHTGPLRLALIGDRWVAIPVAASEAAGFGEADGQLIFRTGNSGTVQALAPVAQLRNNLLVAGCDQLGGLAGYSTAETGKLLSQK